MLRYKDLKKKPKELLAATGLTAVDFEALLMVFAEMYETRYAADQTVEGRRRWESNVANGRR